MKRLVFLIIMFGAFPSAVYAQLPSFPFDIRSLIQQADRRTLRERADELITKRNDYAGAIPCLEKWLSAVPGDAEAAMLLSTCYDSVGRTADARLAMNLALADGLKAREQADRDFPPLFHKQVRWGRSRVLYPAVMKKGEQYRLVLLLHGNGHTPEFMLSWAKTLGLDKAIFICPEAPYMKVRETVTSQRERYSAAGESLGMPDSLFGEIIDLSAEWYHDVAMDAMQRLPVARNLKPIIVGFSQGGFYAHVLATRHPEAYASIVSICASMYTAGHVTEKYDRLRTYGVDALVLHGTKDDVVPLQTGELIHSAMEAARVQHVYMPFDGGHWPSAEATVMIRRWMIEHDR